MGKSMVRGTMNRQRSGGINKSDAVLKAFIDTPSVLSKGGCDVAPSTAVDPDHKGSDV